MPGQDMADPWAEGWDQAGKLRHALLDGMPLPRLPFIPIRLQQGEVAHAEVSMQYSRYYGTNVTYQQSSGFYFGSPLFVATGLAAQAVGNASARSRAQAMAAAQWREHQGVQAYLTNQRVIACVQGHRWLSFWHRGIIQADPVLDHWSLVEIFEEGEPVRWQGPAAPWLAVAIIHLAYGDDHLRNHPGLAPLMPPPGLGTDPGYGSYGGYDFPDGT
ncbi:hypothetical protein [Nocardiopsis nanhaiensis]